VVGGGGGCGGGGGVVAGELKREYRPRGSSWALEEKRTGQDRTGIKSQKELYFTYLGRSPH